MLLRISASDHLFIPESRDLKRPKRGKVCQTVLQKVADGLFNQHRHSNRLNFGVSVGSLSHAGHFVKPDQPSCTHFLARVNIPGFSSGRPSCKAYHLSEKRDHLPLPLLHQTFESRLATVSTNLTAPEFRPPADLSPA